MTTMVSSATIWGIEAYLVQIEVDVRTGLPQMTFVGLPGQAIKESKERVRSAIKNSGFPLPSKKIIVNLAPADLKKEGPSFDLPIAVGILASLGHVRPENLERYTLLGELALTGALRKTKGVLSAALRLAGSSQTLIIPSANGPEASLIREIPIHAASNLLEVVEHLNGQNPLPLLQTHENGDGDGREPAYPFDFQEVRGQWHAKRALEVAVAGGHNVLLVGPPGSGKSMLARRIPTILPDLLREETLELTQIYSTAGLLADGPTLVTKRPFRAPHHTISPAGLVGGGSFPRPGEISLAHHGVLFLDELPEFRRDALETLRAPLEDGHLTISRAKTTVTFPARFMLTAAMNPCRCGFLGHPKRPCRCSLGEVLAYRNKISGPLLDRIDIQIEVPAVRYGDLVSSRQEESSEKIRERIHAARKIQLERFQKDGIRSNSQMGESLLRRYCSLTAAAQKLLETAMNELGFSARSYARMLKVARTLADLSRSEWIEEQHLAEAVQYRNLDRQQV